ncbi:hypothetical protein B0F90DRAFT_917031 [Multifurca ochricompacta]|uniref:G-protein coupled receptors family 1 profile domain-containing protein n=1 Tax=Multifurca ochricompacta TaxID=376703 RepID=A0AAD4QLR9_9AGAM|nr:hypothetical protein B0F90DRAFT_917031 [Multifurca ochricompacta]
MSTPIVTVVIPHFVAFDSGQKSAAIAVFTFALLSTIVLSSVLLSVVWIVFSSIFKRTSCEDLTREAFFFRSQLGQYAVCLLFSNWLSSVSGLMDIEWINGGGVTAGPSCSAQGALSQIGEFGSSFFTITMGIHTFNTLVLRNRQPQWVGIVVTLLGWVAALVIGLGPVSISDRASGPLYNISGFTCGFSKSYQVAHMLLYFLPRFLASFLSVVVFSLIFLMLRGTITINGGLKIQFDPERRLRPRNETFEEYQRFIYSVARKMLWLPITFVLALFPSSIVHLMDISGIAVSSGAMAFSYIFQYLDGVFNVLVLFNVLKALGPAMRMRSTNTNVTSDTEKGDSEKRNVSRPTYDWKPQSTFAPSSQGPVMKTAPPARPPGSILQEYVPQSSSLRESLRQSHKKTGSVGSFTRLLTPEPLSRAHSPSGSIDSHLSVLTALNPQPIVPASVLDAGLLPPLKRSRNIHRLSHSSISCRRQAPLSMAIST